MRDTIALIAGLIGSGITILGLLACFLFGLIPILNAIDTNRTVSILAGIYLLGILAVGLAFRVVIHDDQDTWIYDADTATWIKLP